MVEKVTSRQLIALMTLTRVATVISVMPTINIRPYNQDVWIIVLLSILYIHIFMIPLLFLANKFKDMCIIDYLEKIYGIGIGKVIGVLYGLFFIIQVIDGATIQTELVATSILPDTSQGVIVFGMMLTAVYCVSRGVYTALRTAEILTPITFFIIGFLIVLGVSNFEYNLLLPILADSTLTDINLGAMELSLYFVEIFTLTMLIPYLENKEDINKIFTKSTIYSLVIIAIIIVVCQLTLGVDYMRHCNFPFLHFARSINVFDVFERIDLIAVISWLITSISRLCTALLLSVLAFRAIFNKDNKEKIILIIIGIIASIATFYILNIMSVIILKKYIDWILNILFVIFGIILPSITCIVYFIRRKSIENKSSHI
ncbi:MAG: endospore germination permease [Tissierellaceae bacterium]|nr:endospore germination permease [Tissierellaceae bacterium]